MQLIHYNELMERSGRFYKSVLSKIAERWKEDGESTVNTLSGLTHHNDPGFSGEETNRSVDVFKDTKNTDTRGAQFNNVGHDKINYHGTIGAIKTPSITARS